MTKLFKVTSDYYRSEDGKYEVKKDWAWHYKRLHRVWKMYEDGEYIGQPESLAMAKQWIEIRNRRASNDKI